MDRAPRADLRLSLIHIYSAAEQDVFLQHHGHLVAQRIEVVRAHIAPAHANGALGRVVQALSLIHI